MNLLKLFSKDLKSKKEITSEVEEFSAEKLHKELLAKWIYYSKMIESAVNIDENDINSAAKSKILVDSEILRLRCLNLNSTRECRELESKSQELDKSLKRIEYLHKISKYCSDLTSYLPGAILIPFSEYREILKRYGLCSGLLDNYLGDIPDNVMKSIIKFKNYYSEVHKDILNCNLSRVRVSKLGYPDSKPYYYIKEVNFNYNASKLHKEEVMNRINIFPISETDLKLNYMDLIGIKTGIDKLNFRELQPDQLLISCPREYLKGVEFSVESKIPDPIIFFLCPYGVVAIDMFDDPKSGKLNTSLINKADESINRMLSYNLDKIQ